MKLKLTLLVAFAAFVGNGLFAQSYNVSSGAVCSAYTTKQYTFENTPETPVTVNMSVSWLYCGPWSGNNYGNLQMDIWVDGTWVDMLNTSNSGNGCSWVTSTFTISATTWNNAINSNGGSVLINGYISDSCPGGVGCGGWSDPCFNITASYDYAPSANFEASTTSTCVDGMVTFTNTSSGPQESLNWDFGVGASPATAIGPGPHNVSWDSEGTKDITLDVTGNGDADTEIKFGYVDVGPAPSSVIFGEAFESWQTSHYNTSISTTKTIRNPQGGYYTIGTYTSSYVYGWIQSISETGEQNWLEDFYLGSFGEVNDAVCDANGDIYYTGRYGTDILVGAFAADATPTIFSSYDGATSVGNAITLDDDGNIYIVGEGNGLTDAMAVKLTNTGEELYMVSIEGVGTVYGTDALFVDGYFYMLSWGRTIGINADMHLTKYEPVLGIEQWTFDFNGNGFATDEAHKMVTYGGNIYIMGRSDQGADNGWTLAEVSPDGFQGWESDFLMGEADYDANDRFDVDSEGNLYLASTIDDGGDTTIKLLKINSDNGGLIWQHDFAGIGDTELQNIDCADNGQVFMSGRTMNNSGDWDIVTTEVGQGPNEEWWAVYDGCGEDNDFAGGLIATPNHEVIVTGFNTQAVAMRYGALVEPDASFEIASATTCAGNVIVFENTSQGSALSYMWDFGAGATPATAMGAGPHEVIYDGAGVKNTTLSIENNLGTSDYQLDVTVFAEASISTSADQDICEGEEAAISATGSGTITWDNGLGVGNDFEVSPSETTVYTATVVDGNGCTAEDVVAVNVFDYPAVSAGDDITVCEGVQVTLGGSGEDDLSWDNGAGDGATPTITATETTTYTITASNPAGCDASDSMTLTVNEAPNVSTDADFSICDGESIELTAMGADSYVWFPGEASGDQLADTPTETKTYTVVGTGSNTCEAEAEVTVTVNENPAASAGADDEICSGEDYLLVASGGTSYMWDGLGAGISQTVTPTETTTYNVMVTNAFNCSDEAMVTITVNTTPTANAGEDQVVCIGSSTELVGSGGGSYEWIGLGTGQTITVSPTAATTYTLEVEAANGCTDTDQVLVNVVPLPNVNAGADAAICLGSSTTLNAVGGVTYEWNNGLGEGQSHEVSPLFQTTYIVTATDQFGCMGTDTVIVAVNQVPSANAGADQTICPGESATLNASGGVEYEWNNGAGTGASVVVSPTETTTYTVTAISENQCEGTDEVTVNVYPGVELTIGGLTGGSYCVEDDLAVPLSGDPAGGTFSGPGVSGSDFVPATAGEGTHTIVYMYEDGNGCDNETSVEVVVEICDFVEEWDNWVELFPIPTAGRVTLKWKGESMLRAADLTLIDAQGRLVDINPEIHADQVLFDLSNLATGTYTLVVRQGEKLWTKGVVLER